MAKHTFSRLGAVTWLRVANLVMHRHRMSGAAFRRRFHTPQGWRPILLDGVQLFDIATVAVSRYRWRGTKIPHHGRREPSTYRHDLVESRMR